MPIPSESEVLELLRAVIDPELGNNVVDLGMASVAGISPEGVVRIGFKLTIRGCPLRAQLKKDIDTRIASHPGVTKVEIDWGEMTQEERSEVMNKARWNARAADDATQISIDTRVFAISSGKGGVGKSSVTANLAAAMAHRGAKVGVLDADIWGFSIPRMLGLTDRLEARKFDDAEKPMIVPNERTLGHGLLKVVSTGMMLDDEDTALMWRGLMLAKALEQLLNDVRWGELDYLLIDMPPGTGDVHMALARLLPRTELVIVTTPALAAQKVAARAADMARRSFLRVAGVIENMSAFECAHGDQYPLFGAGGGHSLASDVGVPLLGQIPIEPAVSRGGDIGEPAVLTSDSPAARTFLAIADALIADTVAGAELAGCSARQEEPQVTQVALRRN